MRRTTDDKSVDVFSTIFSKVGVVYFISQPVVWPVGIDVREGGEWCVACIALSLTTMNGHPAEL